MSGVRLVIGIVVMGVAVPLMLFVLLDLHTLASFLTLAAVTLFSWGVCDVLATILEKPRLPGRSPATAIRDHSSQLVRADDDASGRE